MKYMFFGSHLDDIELSAGATICKLIDKGEDVHYVGFSPCHNPIRLEIECRNATSALGIPYKNVNIYGIPVRYFNQHRQDIADIIIQSIEKVKPDVVFTHHIDDKHPDHRAVAEETLRVARCSVLSYVTPWNVQAQEDTFFEVTEEDLLRKVSALKCYESQTQRPYMTEDFIIGWSRTTGVKAYLPFAEGFQSVRQIFSFS